MKLPVKQVLSKNKKHYQLIDADGVIIVTDIPQIADALYIEESINNYNKVIDLLKRSKELQNYHIANLNKETEEFLTTKQLI